MLYGHSLPGQPESTWQTLDNHHSGVARLASSFADFGLSETAALLGGTHDIGKCSKAFQNRLRGKGGNVDHTTAAYLYLLEEWKNSTPPQAWKERPRISILRPFRCSSRKIFGLPSVSMEEAVSLL